MTSGDVTTGAGYIIILFSTYLLEKCKKFHMSAKVYISPSRRHRQNMSRQKVVSFYNIPWPPHTRARTYERSRRWGHRRSPPLATGGSILTGWWGIQNERFFTTTKNKMLANLMVFFSKLLSLWWKKSLRKIRNIFWRNIAPCLDTWWGPQSRCCSHRTGCCSRCLHCHRNLLQRKERRKWFSLQFLLDCRLEGFWTQNTKIRTNLGKSSKKVMESCTIGGGG